MFSEKKLSKEWDDDIFVILEDDIFVILEDDIFAILYIVYLTL